MGITSQTHLGLGITTISSIKHESYTIQTSHQTLSASLPGLLLCWSKNYIAAFFPVCRAPNRAPMRASFSRFVVHQIVLQCVLFFTVCLAPNRAPMRAFFRCLMHQIVLQCVLFLAVCRAPNRFLLCGSCSGVSFGKLLLGFLCNVAIFNPS